MAYVIIAIVIALAAAPLLHFLPTKAQLRTSRLRERAAVAGLFVEFRRPAAEDQLILEKIPFNKNRVIYYGRRLRPARGRVRENCAWVRSDAGWRGADRKQKVPLPLASMPPDILCASIDEGSCGVYWEESGNEQNVDEIIAALKAWEQLET